MENSTALSLDHVSVRYVIKDSLSLFRKKHRKRTSGIIRAVNDVSFTVNKGEVIGIIGENGSGKSTLLKAVAGFFETDEGVIDTKGNRVSLLSLGTGFHNDLSARENIILSGMLMGYSKTEIIGRLDEIIDFAELGDFIEYPVRTYSSGMRARLAFSISMILDTDIILIDEVLSVGDESYKQKSYRKLKQMIHNKEHTVLLVSHNIDKLSTLCSRILWLEKGSVKCIGEPAAVISQYLEETRKGDEANG